MNITTETLERCETRLTVEFDAKQVDKLLKKAAKKLSSQYRLPGFRPGKAPYSVVARRLGEDVVQNQVFEDDGQKLVEQALKEADIAPFAQVQMEDMTWNPLTLVLRVPTEPEITLGDYRNIRIEPEPIDDVTDEDVDDLIQRYQEHNAVWVPVERPAEVDDMVSMLVTESDGDKVLVNNRSTDFALTLDDDDSEGNNPTNALIDELVGLSAGEQKVFSLEYPEDWEDETYSGRTITFDVRVEGVKFKEMDEINDEFAQAMSEHDTLAAWQDELRQNLADRRLAEQNQNLGNDLLQQLLESSDTKVEWSPVFEDSLIDSEQQRQVQYLRGAGTSLKFEDLLRTSGITVEQWRESVRPNVVDNIKQSLVLGELAKQEQITVSQMEVLERAHQVSQASQQGEQLWQQIMTSQEQLSTEIMTHKTIEHLAEIAKGNVTEESAQESASEDDTTEAESEATETASSAEANEPAPETTPTATN